MNNPGWESGDKMGAGIAKETLGRKLVLGFLYFLMALGAVFLLVIMQTVAFDGVYFFGVIRGYDGDVFTAAHDGTSTFIYAVITIPVMYLYLKLIRLKSEPKYMNEKLNTAQIVFSVVCALGVSGVVNIYFLTVAAIAEKLTPVADEIQKYSEAVDRYSDIAAVDIPVFDHILNFIGVCILVPVVEELTFRAGVLQTLLKRFRPTVSVLLSAAIFGALHMRSVQIGYAFIAGILLGWIYIYTKSIRSTIIMHMIFNALGSGITTFLQSGMFGDMKAVVEAFTVYTALWEFAFIIPSIVCFIFLRSMYKNSVRIDTGVKPAAALAVDKVAEAAVPVPAPAEDVPSEPSGDENNEQA